MLLDFIRNSVETYPDAAIFKAGSANANSLVYGSDAHSIKEVGHGYHTRWL